MHRMTAEWPKALNCQKNLAYTEHLPPMPKFNSVSLYNWTFFEKQACQKSEMHRMTPE